MSSKRILSALALALLISAVATWLLSRKLSAPSPAPKVLDMQYVAPSRALGADEVLTAQNTELTPWPRNGQIAGAFPRAADVIGRAVLFPLAMGQPILDRDLSEAGSGGGLASKIPNGMRAVALHTDEIVGVAGFLVPGSRLDVLVTYNPGNAVGPLTATVIENALVIAAGHQFEPDPSGKTLDATVVTLLLTPEESQRAVLASTQGTIHFVLRNGGDSGRSAATPVMLSQLVGHPSADFRPPSHAAATHPASPQRPLEIETVLGGTEAGHEAASPNGGAGQ